MKEKRETRRPVLKGCAKVPVMMQMEALECGAACLAMVLAYYQKWIPLEQVRMDCGVSRDGSNAKHILFAARRYGLSAKGYRYEPERLMQKGKFPCIIHWNFNHFVVLCGFRGKHAIINDPARGAISVPMEEFDQAFTGICIIFEPTPSFEPGGKPEPISAFVKRRLKGTSGAMLFVLLTTVVLSMIGIINPVFSRIFMDRLLSGRDLFWLNPFLFCMGGVAIIQMVVLAMRAVNLLKIEGKFAISANAVFFWHLLRLPVGFYTQRMAGDIAGRQKVNETIASSLISQLAPLVLGFCMMIFYFVVMLRYSVFLTVIGVAGIVVNLWIAQIISKKRVNIARVQARDSGKLSGATVSGIGMIESIKAAGAENGFFAKWSGYQAAVNTQNVKYARLNQCMGALPQIVSSVANVAILSVGVYLTMQGAFTVGMILAFQGFMASFAAPAEDLIAAGQSLQELRANMERTEDVLHYPTDVEYDAQDDKKSDAALSGHIEVRNLTFGYSALDAPLITNFDMMLQPGKSVALVGSTGSGKSTIGKLIAGIYRPWSGCILFDGKEMREIRREAFTASLAMVDQEAVLFEDTIANNIRLWDETIENEVMVQAARDAQLHEDIMKRDGGYEARIAEDGKNLSGGQRQRLEIARMLAQEPMIVVLDEATSALDAKTEAEVMRAFRRRQMACVVIAHRISTIRDCDEIIVLNGGKVVERGTHDTLMLENGLYAQLIAQE